MDLLDAVWLIPALPLAGFLALVVGGRKLGEPAAGWLATSAIGGAFLATVAVFLQLLTLDGEERRHVTTLFAWVPVNGFQVDVAFLVDPLSITMALFVSGIGTLIHLYSIGYMHGDERYSKFFVYLNLFAFSMLMLVLADNFLLSFLGWEGVGACSYFLISFWFTRESAAVAGKKAFVTNRIGDFGFMVAMFLLFATLGTLDYWGDHGVFHLVEEGRLSEYTASAVVLLLFVGAAGKSAQLPLYLWLPDAMEGPTPVSALIHAATMVTAGVFLLVRCAPLLEHADPSVTLLIAAVGAATALFAATVACAQDDIKKVLAYSTVSQLGYMVLAVGSGAYVAAIFHMVTHAFFKALLFLGAGSVIHGLHDEQDMKRMGALRKWMPITWVTFLVGWLAISGVPPLSGFWSKDEVLAGAWSRSPVLWAVGLLVALMTAYYMSRQVFLVFYGDERWRGGGAPAPGGSHGEGTGTEGESGELTTPEPIHDDHSGAEPHESPWVMWVPLVVLAGLAAVGGLLNLPLSGETLFLEHWLEPSLGHVEHHSLPTGTKVGLAVAATVAALGGVGLGYLTWYRKRPEENAGLEPAILQKAWGYDAGVAALVGGPGDAAAQGAAAFDRDVVDGAVDGVATLVRSGGEQLRRIQTGYVRNYALGITAGVVLLLVWTIVRVGL
ncbi:MAG TPA: NADH-quinone oxidoreductase subunit L [Acidimicrobiales bacterium]|nr:NADH-quinone oxidoreductase subunit L [Acidimicrobiales bacterium]